MSTNRVCHLADRDDVKFHNCFFVDYDDVRARSRKQEDGDTGYTLVFRVDHKKEPGLFVETAEVTDNSLRQQLTEGASTYWDVSSGCLCIHVRTVEDNPNQVSIGVHGFLSESLSDPSQLNFLRCGVTLLLTRRRFSDFVDETLMIEADIDLSSPRCQVCDIPGESDEHCEGCGQDGHFECDKYEDFFEALSKPFVEDLSSILKLFDEDQSSSAILLSAKVVIVKVTETIRRRVTEERICEKLKGLPHDMTIVARGGVEIPCHTHFVAAHSGVLAKTLKYTPNNQLNMFSTSEQVVRALLAFIYDGDLEGPMNDSSLAVDVLQVAHRDEIKSLEMEVKKILLKKPNEWFEPELAFELYEFVKLVDTLDDVKLKALKVMKSKAGFTKLPFFDEFFKKDSTSALELCQCLIDLK